MQEPEMAGADPSGALAHDGYDNNVSRITDNVLKRFASAEPL